MNVTTRFGEDLVSLAESYSDDAGEPAAPEGGGRFAEYAMISLHGMRIFLGSPDDEIKEEVTRHSDSDPYVDPFGEDVTDFSREGSGRDCDDEFFTTNDSLRVCSGMDFLNYLFTTRAK